MIFKLNNTLYMVL